MASDVGLRPEFLLPGRLKQRHVVQLVEAYSVPAFPPSRVVYRRILHCLHVLALVCLQFSLQTVG